MEKENKGLKKLRKVSGKKYLTNQCGNCKCTRYSQCNCMKKGEKRNKF